jgi:hypothetical protein
MSEITTATTTATMTKKGKGTETNSSNRQQQHPGTKSNVGVSSVGGGVEQGELDFFYNKFHQPHTILPPSSSSSSSSPHATNTANHFNCTNTTYKKRKTPNQLPLIPSSVSLNSFRPFNTIGSNGHVKQCTSHATTPTNATRFMSMLDQSTSHSHFSNNNITTNTNHHHHHISPSSLNEAEYSGKKRPVFFTYFLWFLCVHANSLLSFGAAVIAWFIMEPFWIVVVACVYI